jgi:1,4-dihydroxy-2-naphthoate octaprenyltransferase
MQASIRSWLMAARLRTLPLALSSVLLGSCLAYAHEGFEWSVLLLAILTTLCLQVLSNFANDYGDAVKGLDDDSRVGPQRAIQSGALTKAQMKTAIMVLALVAFGSGILLVWKGTRGLTLNHGLFFIGLGLLAIAAAIKYTVGKRPYGYRALGDVFVFIFFGLTGVLGTYFLHAQTINWDLLLPASAIGLLSAGVLNLNNMRDREADQSGGKITLAVLLGPKRSKTYHYSLIVSAIAAGLTYTLLNLHSGYQFLFLLTIPLLAKNMKAVAQNSKPALLDPQLKKLAMATFLFTLLFGIGIILP